MSATRGICRTVLTVLVSLVVLASLASSPAIGDDLPEIRKRGVLRHLGVPYANFVTGSGDGLDVDLIKQFAKHLGVRYVYVRTSWSDVIGDLTGENVKAKGDDVERVGKTPVKGDLIANGMTILPWRQKMVAFSKPTFATQVWLVARADSTLQPIKPTRKISEDIAAVKKLLRGRHVLGKTATCLDPKLYALEKTGARITLFEGTLNELAPAILKREAEATILDVPDALIALQKWPGQLKIIGPICARQTMGVGFARNAPKLREAFDEFLASRRKDGSYRRLVAKYYPGFFARYPKFFPGK